MLLVSCLMVACQFCKATARQTLVAATKLPSVWWPSDHLSHVDCDPDSNSDSGPGARVNTTIIMLWYGSAFVYNFFLINCMYVYHDMCHTMDQNLWSHTYTHAIWPWCTMYVQITWA